MESYYIKHFFACDTLLSYPIFNKRFNINTDASDNQLGALIIQGGKTIVLYSRKLTENQTWYTITEK